MTVDVPLKRRAQGRANPCIAAVTLNLTPLYRSTYTAPATPVFHAKCFKPVNGVHKSAASNVSQPKLLLPTEAVNDQGFDSAETRTFSLPLAGSLNNGSVYGRPMLVRLWTQAAPRPHACAAVVHGPVHMCAEAGADTCTTSAAVRMLVLLGIMNLLRCTSGSLATSSNSSTFKRWCDRFTH